MEPNDAPIPADDPTPNHDRDLDGAAPDDVAAALAERAPLSGLGGFAGRLAPAAVPDAWTADPPGGDLLDRARAEGSAGLLVRDVLGRRPVYYDETAPTRWAFAPTPLDDPRLLPAGAALVLDERLASADAPEPVPVWSLPDPEPRPAAAAIEAVEAAIRESLRAVDPEELAVAFSGGVDSAVVAAGVPTAPLYVAGFEGSHDRAAARAAATAADRADALQVVDVDHDGLRAAARAVVAVTGRTNPMDVQIAVPLFAAARAAAADGRARLAVGQGADELFGGYAKVVDPAEDARVDADTVRGARRETIVALPDGLARDVLTLRAAGVEPVAPLLADRVVDAALRLPAAAIAVGSETEPVTGAEGGTAAEERGDTGERRKIALRAAARGLAPDAAVEADKKAVQYGSYVARELDRLARRAGYKRRMDDHVGRYVRALADDRLGEDLPGDDHGESG